MTALAWLNDLAQWFARWIPRLTLIEPTHRGVLFGPRGGARKTGPGLVLFWPITHALTLVPITVQSVQLSSQVLPIRDQSGAIIPRILLVAVAIQFRVDDPVAFATRSLNAHALVDNRTAAAIARQSKLQLDIADIQSWAASAKEDVVEELKPYGVVVERLDITQSGYGVALKNVADWNFSEHQGGKRLE